MTIQEDPFPTHTREQLSRVDESDFQAPSSAPQKPKRSLKDTHIQLAVPHNGITSAYSLISILGASVEGAQPNIITPAGSLLCRVFNMCWTAALNASPRPEFFVMHHSDIQAERGWLDKLVRLMDETGADIISCNVPIKDASGELSTAVFHYDGIYPRGDRVRMDEAKQLPDTFTIKELEEKFPEKYKGGKLLVNSGLWICRFRDAKKIVIEDAGSPLPSAREVPWIENFFFHMQDSITRNGDTFSDNGLSEDWQASLDWENFGLDYRATSAVKVLHFGNWVWEFGGSK
jgi:hypothetical protein